MAWWIFFPIVFFVGFVLVLTLISLAAWTVLSGRWAAGKSGQVKIDSALQITRERYAKGELTKEQFEQITKDLHQD